MGISAVDELLMQSLTLNKTPPRIRVPFIAHEVTLFIASWLGLFFLDDPASMVTVVFSILRTLCVVQVQKMVFLLSYLCRRRTQAP